MGASSFSEHGPEVFAILSTLGAATGAITAILVYALCARRRRPLNWFEKDLLDRAEEAEKLSTENCLGNPHSSINILRKQSTSRAEDEWQHREGIFNNRVLGAREASVTRHLSECSCDEANGVSMSPLAPPLPGDTVLVSDERMVILKPLPISICKEQSHGRLSSSDSDEIPCPKSANEVRGEVKLELTHDATAGLLTVKLVEARDLRARELSETADPYAKIRLLPDRSIVMKTQVHRQTLNPVFEEVFVFQVPPNCLLTERTLEVLLYDFDTSTKHRAIGYAQIQLSTISDLGLEPKIINKSIFRYGSEGRSKAPPLCDLMVSLCYQPSAEKLTVIVIRARNLPVDECATLEPFVQVNIIKDGKSIKKKKTNINKDGSSPCWSETLNFSLPLDVLAQCSLDFSIYKANGTFLARCEVSQDIHPELFERVLTGSGASAQWLPLLSEIEKTNEQIAN